MLPIVGTIRNSVKLAEMNAKWEQKKKSGGKAFQKEMTPQERQIRQYQEDLQKMRESNALAEIHTKLKTGADLTPEEIEYLKRNYPEAYQEYEEIRQEKKAYQEKLKACRTKEEVERLRLNQMGNFLAQAKQITNNPNIPKGKKLQLIEKLLKKVMGVQEVHQKFVESARYQSLPTEEEKAEEAKEKRESAEETAEDMAVREDEETKEAVTSEEAAATEAVEKGEPEKDDAVQEKKLKPVKAEQGKSAEAVPAESDFSELAEVLQEYIRKNRTTGFGLL